MNEERTVDDENQKPEPPINDKLLIYSILGMLAIGFVSVLFVAVPWLLHDGSPSWKEILIDDSIIIVAILLFVYSFYMNTKMH
ncbi:MAG: hypothetical protein E2O43_04795 [Nitrospina sp.]|nr:MAG: hypothetical protein E2O43_04795 [Nitrospina sp.]